MSYVSLYRKYRPRTFAEVAGQDHVTRTLARAVDEGRWHHAYLFTGPRGTGKTSTARILAMAINATAGPSSSPPSDDPLCLAIANGTCVDVVELDAASHGGVDDVRDLRERVAFSPAQARTKVYIVDECHMLSPQGWNAFLKTVEEPPGHVVFVFATTEPHKVLPTILSRTQRFDFRRAPAAVLEAHCRRIGDLEGFTFEPGALDLIVRAGDGSFRDTLSVLDQVVAYTGSHVTAAGVGEVLGVVPTQRLDELTLALGAGDVGAVLTLVGRLADEGHDLRQFGAEVIDHLRGLLLLQVAPDAGLIEATPDRLAALVAESARMGRIDLLRAIDLVGDALVVMRRGNTRLPLEVALAKAALPESSGDPAALAARLDRLEHRLAARSPGAGPAKDETTDESPTAPSEAVAAAPVADAAAPSAPLPAADQEGPPAEAPPAPVADLGIDAVLVAWPAVVEAVRGRRVQLAALLGAGEPARVDERMLFVEFPYEFHATALGEPSAADVIDAVLAELLGRPLHLRCEVAGGAPQAVTPGDADTAERAAVVDAEAAEAAGDVPDADELHADAVARITAGFDAVVVDRD